MEIDWWQIKWVENLPEKASVSISLWVTNQKPYSVIWWVGAVYVLTFGLGLTQTASVVTNHWLSSRNLAKWQGAGMLVLRLGGIRLKKDHTDGDRDKASTVPIRYLGSTRERWGMIWQQNSWRLPSLYASSGAPISAAFQASIFRFLSAQRGNVSTVCQPRDAPVSNSETHTCYTRGL